MENDDDYEAQIQELRRKLPKRSRKCFPNISQRLQPDFNAKVAALSLNESKEGLQVQKPSENDILDFKNVLKYLPQMCILEYLQKILEFLRNDDEEICLNENGALGPFRESFLVKIASNNEYLKSPELGPAASIVGSQILDVVEENQHVFKWIHDFEGGSAKNFLVYRKEYTSHQKIIKKPAKCESDSRVKGSIPLTSTLNIFQPSKSSNMSLTTEERQDIPASFRINWLNITLRFLKDNTKLILKYPEMKVIHARFLYSLLCQRNHGNEDIGFGFKSIYSPLFDTMKALSCDYDFDVRFAEKFGLAQVTLEKIPKNKDVNKKPEDKDSISQPNPKTPTKEKPSPKSEPTVQTNSKPDKNEAILNNVSNNYVKTTLKQIAEFIEDECQASYMFDKVTEEQISFIRQVPSLSRNPIQHKFLNEQCTALMNRIAQFYKQDAIKMVFSCTKFKKHSCVTLRKEPKYGNDSNKPSNTGIRYLPARKIQTENEFKDTGIEDKNTASEAKNTEFGTKNTEIGTKNTETGNKDTAISKYTEIEATNTVIESKNTAVINDKDDAKKLSPATDRVGKLMQSLNTPINSQIGEKLMRQMGWDGGALGLREGGLIEPIIPALHLKPGAGFGHVKPMSPKTTQISDRVEFRMFLFEHVLAFLQSTKTNTNITFPKQLNKKDFDFTLLAMSHFNRRTQIGLSTAAEIALTDEIFDELMNDLELRIAFDFVDRRTLQLTKKLGDPVVIKPKKKKKGAKMQVTEENQVTDIMKQYDLEPLCPTQKSAKKLAEKIHFLEKIKDFLLTDRTVKTKEIKVDAELGRKNKMYIQRVVADINKRIFRPLPSELEQEKLNEIKNIRIDYQLSVEFNTCILTLKKLYPHRRPVQLPSLLKSRDIENTVIYVNNTAIKMSELKNHCTENGEVFTNRSCDYEFIDKTVNDKNGVNDENVTVLEEDLVDTYLDISKDSLDRSDGSIFLEVIEKKSQEGNIEKTDNTEDDYHNFVNDLKEVNNNRIQNNYDKQSSELQIATPICDRKIEAKSKEMESNNEEYSKYISIFCKNGDNITLELIKKVQTTITNVLEDNTFLPRIKCHGVKNGGLVYSCHDEKSFDWLTQALSVAKVRILDTDLCETNRQMSMKINSFINEDVKLVFKRLEKYYSVLKTENWIVKSEKILNGCVVYCIEMEAKDFKFICENKFSLYAGVDMIEFNVERDSDNFILV